MKTARVTVVPYDAGWKDAFDRIKEEIEEALGALALGIEHVGSTSVEGMYAKPCIDLDVIVGEDAMDAVIRALAEIGYIHEGNLGIEGREAFCYEGKTHLMKHHLYVCPKGSRELCRHVAFRDYLRSTPLAVEKYSAVKREAARRFPEDIDGYIAYKSPCIEELYEEIGNTFF